MIFSSAIASIAIKLIKRDIERSGLSKPIRDGFLIGILGKPNTGKSSFLNYISGREVAIVTNIPGTTTDSLEVPIDIDGYKFRFIDTAGIRKHKNVIEKIGVERARKISLYSNLNVVFLDRFEKEKYKDMEDGKTYTVYTVRVVNGPKPTTPTTTARGGRTRRGRR